MDVWLVRKKALKKDSKQGKSWKQNPSHFLPTFNFSRFAREKTLSLDQSWRWMRFPRGSVGWHGVCQVTEDGLVTYEWKSVVERDRHGHLQILHRCSFQEQSSCILNRLMKIEQAKLEEVHENILWKMILVISTWAQGTCSALISTSCF